MTFQNGCTFTVQSPTISTQCSTAIVEFVLLKIPDKEFQLSQWPIESFKLKNFNDSFIAECWHYNENAMTYCIEIYNSEFTGLSLVLRPQVNELGSI